jgi:hypothetical protein
MISVYEKVFSGLVRDCEQYDLHPEPHKYAREKINAMTNEDLLLEISWWFEDMENGVYEVD